MSTMKTTSARDTTAPIASNVLSFSRARSLEPVKPRRRGRKTKTNVLKFTGKTIRNIEGEAHLPGWKKNMVEQLTKALDKVLRGEVVGLMMVTSQDFPSDDGYKEGKVVLCGAYCADFGLVGWHSEWIADKAREMAEDSPARWV